MNAKRTLTHDDVSRLISDPSGEHRAHTAAKIATDFGEGGLSEAERAIAEEIFRLMVKDAEVRVREALAQNLMENPAIPHDIAVSLAKDVDSVALPVIQFSEVLSDEDLIEIINTQEPSKQKAIAARPQISETVSDALVDTKNEDVVTELVANAGAAISERSLQKVINHHGESERVQSVMVTRPQLPARITERLLTTVSEQMKTELAKHQDLPATMATDLILQSRERATINLSTESTQTELEQMIESMRQSGRLTPSIMIRALCMGDLNFYETALAALSGVPLLNVRKLVHDSGPLGLRAIYDETKLPPEHYPAVRAAIDVAEEMEYDGEPHDRERYSRRMIERILTQYGDLGVDFDSDDLEYLLTKMSDLHEKGGGFEPD